MKNTYIVFLSSCMKFCDWGLLIDMNRQQRVMKYEMN